MTVSVCSVRDTTTTCLLPLARLSEYSLPNFIRSNIVDAIV